jgi:hypothetical protein
MSDIPLEDETRSVEEIITAAKNVINSWSPQFTADEVLAVANELDAARAKLTAIAGLEDVLVPDSEDGRGSYDRMLDYDEVQAILNENRMTND